jgi:hypothetical protein
MSAQNQNPNNHVNLFVDKLCSIFVKDVFDANYPNPMPCVVTDVTASGVSVRHGDSDEFADFIPWFNVLSIRHTAPLLSDECAPTLSAEAVIKAPSPKITRKTRRKSN